MTTTAPITIDLGDEARDRITGFSGIVTGVCSYITGCTQLLLAPPAKDGAHVEAHWYDVDRCERTQVAAIDLGPITAPGPDKAAPVR